MYQCRVRTLIIAMFLLHSEGQSGELCRCSDYVMGWSFEKSSSCSRQEQEIFPFSKASKPALGSNQPPIQWVPRVKKPGLEADNPLQSSAEVKIE